MPAMYSMMRLFMTSLEPYQPSMRFMPSAIISTVGISPRTIETIPASPMRQSTISIATITITKVSRLAIPSGIAWAKISSISSMFSTKFFFAAPVP